MSTNAVKTKRPTSAHAGGSSGTPALRAEGKRLGPFTACQAWITVHLHLPVPCNSSPVSTQEK